MDAAELDALELLAVLDALDELSDELLLAVLLALDEPPPEPHPASIAPAPAIAATAAPPATNDRLETLESLTDMVCFSLSLFARRPFAEPFGNELYHQNL